MMAGATLLPAAMALPFLLLGLGAVAADKQPPIADMANGVMRRFLETSSDAGCQTELSACTDDTSCMTCATELADYTSECEAAYDATCDGIQDFYCCLLGQDGLDENCDGNSMFSDYIECFWRYAVDVSGECEYGDVDLSECNGVTGSSFTWGVRVVLCLTTATGLLLSTIGFIV